FLLGNKPGDRQSKERQVVIEDEGRREEACQHQNRILQPLTHRAAPCPDRRGGGGAAAERLRAIGKRQRRAAEPGRGKDRLKLEIGHEALIEHRMGERQRREKRLPGRDAVQRGGCAGEECNGRRSRSEGAAMPAATGCAERSASPVPMRPALSKAFWPWAMVMKTAGKARPAARARPRGRMRHRAWR